MWNLEKGQLLRTLEGHLDVVNVVVPMPDGRRAISWSDDQTLRLWDLPECRENKRFVGDDRITHVAYSIQCQLLLAGDTRGRVMTFDVPP